METSELILTGMICLCILLSITGIVISTITFRKSKKMYNEMDKEKFTEQELDVWDTTMEILKGDEKCTSFEKYCYLKVGIILFEQIEMYEVCERIKKILETPEMCEIADNFDTYFIKYETIF